MAWIGTALGAGRDRLCRGGPARLVLAGATVTLVVTGIAALAGGALAHVAAVLGPAGLVLEALALKMTLSARSLAAAARGVGRDLERNDLTAARTAVGRHLVSRSTVTLDASRVASAAVESVAENLTDAITAPLLFYLAFGLPGAFAYRALNTADAMLGYREGALEHFGKVAARLDDLANLAPARLGALALVVAAALVGAEGRRAWRAMWRDHARTSSPNAGWTMAAMAGALGVRLEKPGHYVLGNGRLPGVCDIEAAIRVMKAAATLITAMVAGLAFVLRAVI